MSHEVTELVKHVANLIVDFLVKYSFQVVGGIVILLVGLKVAGWMANAFTRFCRKKSLDPTLTQFASGAIRIIVVAFAVLVALEKFGITIAPLIAAGSALLFGGSFAIQGTLSNYAAGLSIILGRPFVVGNTIQVAGVSGVVEEVKIARTVLSTADGERIIVPNKHIVGEIIYNSRENRLVESNVGISYSSDPHKAIAVILETFKKFPQIASMPVANVGIQSFGDSAVIIGMRYWVPTRNYFQSTYDVNLAVYQALQQANITIPFPQRDIHLIQKLEK